MNIFILFAPRNDNLDILSIFHLRNNAATFDYIRDFTCNYQVFNNQLNFSLKRHVSQRYTECGFHCLKIPGELI